MFVRSQNNLLKTIVKVIFTVRILAWGITPLELRPMLELTTLFGFGEPRDVLPTAVNASQ